MKKSLVPFTLFVLVAILFSSCGNSSKLTFTKRHYRSGYYVNFGGKNHTTTTSAVKLPEKTKYQTVAAPAAKPMGRATENSPVAPPKIQNRISNKPVAEKEQIFSTTTATALTINQKASTQNTWVNDDVMGSSGDGNHSRNNASVPFVVIVIFAIIIPPLGVGLMYGINNYFWIDLILTLLFFFPGMIFALVVVLM
jgi:uncharacterized membrane protein YqaE (UPF0057 family)